MKITLQLSCYNGARYLPFLFASIKQQTKQDWRFLMLDNASTQEEAHAIQQAVQAAGFAIELFRVEQNIGFAGAHNFLFEKHKHDSDYVVLLNDDAILEPTYLDELVSFLETHPESAAAEGIVYRWDFEHHYREDNGKTSIVDTMGLRVFATGAVSDIHAGDSINQVAALTTHHPPLTPFRVFGVSGCLPCYRVRALRAVSPDHTLFDPTFVIYKEDVELAYRLRAAGFTAYTIPSAIAYHRRSLGKGVKHTPDPQAAYRSYHNHLWVHFMHTRVRELFTTRWLVLPYEGLKKMYWLMRKPSFVFRVFADLCSSWNDLMRKRLFVRSLREATQQRHGTPPSFSHTYDCDVAVIMVSHNDLSEACLRSIQEARKHTSLKIQLVVADNQSHKYHANEFVEPIVPDAIVLLRNGDYGYGRSCNRAAREVNAKYYFILNPDTVLSDLELFDKCVAYLQTHPDVGMIAPKIYYFDGRLQETCRRFPKWFMPFVTRTGLQHRGWGKRYMDQFAMRDYDHRTKRNVDWVQGSAMFIDGDLWRTLDGFDDRYWLYFEDIDLCRRIHLAGKEIVYDPETGLQHAHGKESAAYANILMNLLKKKEARGHIISWLKYLWKWMAK